MHKLFILKSFKNRRLNAKNRWKTHVCICVLLLSGFSYIYGQKTTAEYKNLVFYPSHGEENINPDLQLRITFSDVPLLGNTGAIRIYNASNDELVDSFDMSLPPGPKNTRTLPAYENLTYTVEEEYNKLNKTEKGKVFVKVPLEDIYQKKYIGGKLESDVYHFYPILINESVVTICPRNNHLDYNNKYYVQIDTGVLSFGDGTLFEISDKSWTFSTKKSAPSLEREVFVVSQDGRGDFQTVQGAIDFFPVNNTEPKTIFIRNGRYEEIVYFRNKNKLTFLGEDREKTVICYANNGFFNPRPTGGRVEMIKRFRNRRSIFAVHNSKGVNLMNLSVVSLGKAPAQAEGLLVRGEEIIVKNVTIDASGDALQATGKIYMEDVSIKGFGDNVLGYGAVFFKDCEFISTYGPHLWPRNTQENHGNVLVNCKLWTEGDVEVAYSRAPVKKHYSFPHTEAVLIDCLVEGVKPEGWGATDSLCLSSQCYEYNTLNLGNGEPVDAGHRVHYSRQLTWENDSVLISNYRTPEYVLDGWSPNPGLDIDTLLQKVKSKSY